MFCGKCGKQIPDGSAFCPYCGFMQPMTGELLPHNGVPAGTAAPAPPIPPAPPAPAAIPAPPVMTAPPVPSAPAAIPAAPAQPFSAAEDVTEITGTSAAVIPTAPPAAPVSAPPAAPVSAATFAPPVSPTAPAPPPAAFAPAPPVPAAPPIPPAPSASAAPAQPATSAPHYPAAGAPIADLLPPMEGVIPPDSPFMPMANSSQTAVGTASARKSKTLLAVFIPLGSIILLAAGVFLYFKLRPDGGLPIAASSASASSAAPTVSAPPAVSTVNAAGTSSPTVSAGTQENSSAPASSAAASSAPASSSRSSSASAQPPVPTHTVMLSDFSGIQFADMQYKTFFDIFGDNAVVEEQGNGRIVYLINGQRCAFEYTGSFNAQSTSLIRSITLLGGTELNVFPDITLGESISYYNSRMSFDAFSALEQGTDIYGSPCQQIRLHKIESAGREYDVTYMFDMNTMMCYAAKIGKSTSPSGITAVNEGVYKYTLDKLNLRQSAGTSGKLITELKKGVSILTIPGTEVSKDGYLWVQCVYNNKIAWASKNYLCNSASPSIRIMTARGNIVLRRSPSNSGREVYKIAGGSQLRVVEGSEYYADGITWVLVDYDDEVNWADLSSLY